MQIKLKSNRKIFIYPFLILLIITIIVAVFLSIALIINHEKREENIGILMLFIALIGIEVFIVLLIRFIKGKSYIFEKDKITVFKRNVLQYEILVKNIRYMNYDRFRFLDLIGILGFPGEIPMEIQIKEENGKIYKLGFIAFKDAKRLKKLFPDLLVIYDAREN